MRNKQTHIGLGNCGKGFTDGERLQRVDIYTTTESDKTTKLLLFSGENNSLDLTIIGSINAHIITQK